MSRRDLTSAEWRRKVDQLFAKLRQQNRESDSADRKPRRCEADTTGLTTYYTKYGSKLGSQLHSSPRNFRLKPRPTSVGTQTWPLTHFKPLTREVVAHKNSNEASKTDFKESEESNSFKHEWSPKIVAKSYRAVNVLKTISKSKTGSEESTTIKYEWGPNIAPKSNRAMYIFKNSKRSKGTKTKKYNLCRAFSMLTSKRGRFDHATTKRSESPVNCTNAKPSSPFQ